MKDRRSLTDQFWRHFGHENFELCENLLPNFEKSPKMANFFFKNQFFWAQNVLKTDFVMHKKLATVRMMPCDDCESTCIEIEMLEDRYMKDRIARRIEK